MSRLGKVDYMEILGFSDHRSTARVWYQLLNLGFRIPAAGGTDAMANYSLAARTRGHEPGLRARTPSGEITPAQWMACAQGGAELCDQRALAGLHAGRRRRSAMNCNSTGRSRAVEFSVRLRSIVAVDHLELVCNGRVVRVLRRPRKPIDHGEFSGSIALKDSGWCVVRASTDAGALSGAGYLCICDHEPRST